MKYEKKKDKNDEKWEDEVSTIYQIWKIGKY